MLSQMWARFCTGHNSIVKGDAHCLPVSRQGRKPAFSFPFFKSKLAGVKNPDTRCFLSTLQGNSSTQQSYLCRLPYQPAGGGGHCHSHRAAPVLTKGGHRAGQSGPRASHSPQALWAKLSAPVGDGAPVGTQENGTPFPTRVLEAHN